MSMEIVTHLMNTPPGTLVLLIGFILAIAFRAFVLSASAAHRTTADLAVRQTETNHTLYGKLDKLRHENGVLSAEVYRLKDALNDCLNRGEP